MSTTDDTEYDPAVQDRITQDTDTMSATNPDEIVGPRITLAIHHHGQPLQVSLPEDGTLADLATHLATTLSIPETHQKFLITPKIGLLKPPFDTPSIALSTLTSKKIVLMGTTPTEVNSLSASITRATASTNPRRFANGPVKPATPARTRDPKRIHAESTYTFHTLRPLPYFSNPDASLRFLERLRDDAGIRAAMAKWQFSVGLLTEMDPALHTTHESRTLGLNRNRGEVIELRLRTDAGDGYRDYGTIRQTLCHELAHNVWGDHDKNFWALYREINAVVERVGGAGRSLDGGRAYGRVDEEEEHVDGGGWTGGEFIVGGRPTSDGGIDGSTGIGRREIMARAAEERLKKEKGTPDQTGSA
jgi:WLM domain